VYVTFECNLILIFLGLVGLPQLVVDDVHSFSDNILNVNPGYLSIILEESSNLIGEHQLV